MSGRPKLREFARQIEEMGGDDVILDLIAGAVPMREIGKRLGCSPAQLYRWRNLSEERQKAWAEAREIAGHVVMEEGMGILDDGKPITAAEASLLKSRAEYRKHLASLWNRRELGEAKSQEVTLNLGDAFRDMLEAINRPPALPEADEPVDADFTLEDDDADALCLEGSD